MTEIKICAFIWGLTLGCVLVMPWLFNFIGVYTSWVNGIFK